MKLSQATPIAILCAKVRTKSAKMPSTANGGATPQAATMPEAKAPTVVNGPPITHLRKAPIPLRPSASTCFLTIMDEHLGDDPIAFDIGAVIGRALARVKADLETGLIVPDAWRMTIVRVENGYVLCGHNDSSQMDIVLEEKLDTVASIRQTMTDVLMEVARWFGHDYDGFSANNLNISWDKKGDELE